MNVYADHAATTRPAPEVVDAMRPWLGEQFGNASSVHARGEQAREAIEQARAQVASLIGADPEELVFTATGSEANNLALIGTMAVAEGRRRVVVTGVEHPSVLETARHLESRGFALTVVSPEPNGIVDPARVAAVFGPDVALVSVMAVNNEIGTIQPIAEIAALAKAAGARVHCDAIQAVGKLPVSVRELGVDLLSLAGHKFEGPLGAAALWVRRRVRVAPLIHGGHQEQSRRAGTENVAAIVGLGVAADRAAAWLGSEGPARVTALGNDLLAGLETRIEGTRLHGDRERRAPGMVNVGFAGVDGEAVLHELDREGVTVSTGSACSAASPGPSHVLLALGLAPEEAHASVRFSLGAENDSRDVEHVLNVTPGIVERLRSLAAPKIARSA